MPNDRPEDQYTAAPSHTLGDLPVATVKVRRRGPSLVWLLPFLALLIGGWLVFKAWSEKGPEITISFNSAKGIEAGKTRIRYKNVDIGKVVDLNLDGDLSQVLIKVALTKSIEPHLHQNSRFWVVRPNISLSGISGLSTLVSGVYIAFDPGDQGESRKFYQGLEKPPRIESNVRGSTYLLHTDHLGSLDIGTPIYYRQIRVGEITEYHLNPDNDVIQVSIFIHAPYDKHVRNNSRFWKASGIEFNLTPDGFQVHMESVASLIAGGIAFDTPMNLDSASPIHKGHVFPLFKNYANSREKELGQELLYIMHFDGSLRGLSVDAPVEFRGTKVGKVKDIQLQMDPETLDINIPVLVALYPDRFSISGTLHNSEDAMKTLVQRGLRAQLTIGSLLTGKAYINMEFADEKTLQAAEINYDNKFYPKFPTIPEATQQLTNTATEILNTIAAIPFLQLSQDLQGSIQDFRTLMKSSDDLMTTSQKLVNSPDIRQSLKDMKQSLTNIRKLTTELKADTSKQLGASLNQLDSTLKTAEETLKSAQTAIYTVEETLKSAQTTMQSAEQTFNTANNALDENTPLYYEIQQLMENLSTSADAFSALADYLRRNPNALIFGNEAVLP